MKINNTYGEGTRYAYIGGIVGSNANEGSFATVTK